VKPFIATLVATGAALALSGCPKKAEDGLRDASNANGMTCATERRSFQTALEAFTLLWNRPPVNELEMVPDYLHTESVYFDISPTGGIVAAPGSACN
jgi:hypothetical protein